MSHVKDLEQMKLVSICGEPKISVCFKEASLLTWTYLDQVHIARIHVLKYKSAHSNILSRKDWKTLKINMKLSDTKRENGCSNSAGKVTFKMIIMMRLPIMDK